MSIRGFLCCQAEDGIRELVRSRGLGDVYKRQRHERRGKRGECARAYLRASEQDSR